MKTLRDWINVLEQIEQSQTNLLPKGSKTVIEPLPNPVGDTQKDVTKQSWPPKGTKTVIEPIPTTQELQKYDQPPPAKWPKPGYEGRPELLPTVPKHPVQLKKVI